MTNLDIDSAYSVVRQFLDNKVLAVAVLLASAAVSSGDTLNADYVSPTMVPVTASGYSAGENEVNFSLSYAPTPGTDLTVVKNTGIGFISGEFANLAQGATVALSYGGATYTYVANYYGGTGNDLVLHWAKRRIVSFGVNTNGRLGNGSDLIQEFPLTVTESGVLAGKTVMAISCRGIHCLALCTDGTIVGWGKNWQGELGDGTTTERWTPVAVDQSGVLAGKRVVAISAGSSYSLALCSDGTVAAWGWNKVGQLGDGSNIDSTVPVLVNASGVLAGKTVVAISAGLDHATALCSDGTLAAWGNNVSGQLGNGTVKASPVPVAVNDSGALLGKSVISISTGTSHSLAVCADGTLVSWGSNTKGQLGIGSTSIVGNNTDSRIAVDITETGGLAAKTVIQAAAGGTHNLALCADGTIGSWGSNASHQLANGTDLVTPLPEVARGGSLEDIFPISIVGGNTHSLVLGGVPANSKLSDLVLSAGSFSPAFVSKTSDYVKTVSSGVTSIKLKPTSLNALAQIKVNGVVTASGVDSGSISLAPGINSIPIVVTAEDGTKTQYTVKVMRSANLNATFQSDTDIPVVFPQYDATGRSATFALNFRPSMGTSLTVIDNTGLGFITGQFTNLAQGQAVNLGYQGTTYHFVANYYGGTGNDLVLEWAKRSIAAWGSNESRQLGNGSVGDKKIPVSVIRTGALAGKCVISVGAAEDFGIALSADGNVVSWSTKGNGIPIKAPLEGAAAGKRVLAISSANRDSLILLSDGTLWMGASGNFTRTATDAGVLKEKSVVAISKGGSHCLALCSDGTIAAWGNNDCGQLGDGTKKAANTPVAVKDSAMFGKTVIAVATGLDHSMALCSDGTLLTWGRNGSGQLGDGSTTDSAVPLAVSGKGVLRGKKVVALSQGAKEHSVVLCSDGTVATWGLSDDGQLGRNTTTFKSAIPGPIDTTGVLSGKRVISISSGSRHNIAICADGTVATWGDNSRGQLGNDSTTSSSVPVKVVDIGEIYGKKPLTSAAAMQSQVIMAEADTGYSAWAAEYSSISDKLPSSDLDTDGIPNLLEYVLQGNPDISSTTILPIPSTSGGNFIFSFNRLASSAADTTQVFQYSTDLVSWTNVDISSTPGSGVALGSVDGAGGQPVTVTVPQGANKQIYGRLFVGQP